MDFSESVLTFLTISKDLNIRRNETYNSNKSEASLSVKIYNDIFLMKSLYVLRYQQLRDKISSCVDMSWS